MLPWSWVFGCLDSPPLLGQNQLLLKEPAFTLWTQEMFMGLLPFPGAWPGNSAHFTTKATGMGSRLAIWPTESQFWNFF